MKIQNAITNKKIWEWNPWWTDKVGSITDKILKNVFLTIEKNIERNT